MKLYVSPPDGRGSYLEIAESLSTYTSTYVHEKRIEWEVSVSFDGSTNAIDLFRALRIGAEFERLLE